MVCSKSVNTSVLHCQKKNVKVTFYSEPQAKGNGFCTDFSVLFVEAMQV